MAKQRIEECSPEELSLEGIRKRTAAFNEMFERHGGCKTYELQCIEILLEEIDRLQVGKTVSTNEGKS